MLNYEMPFTKYFYDVTSGILENYYIIQNLNFNPAYMLTHNGIFFDNTIKENSYFFTQNEKMTLTEQELNEEGLTTNGCLIGIYFWMQNTLQYYERHYDRVQDILSDIGGINTIVLTIVSVLNLLIHNFIVILDTEKLALNLEQENYKSRSDLTKGPTILRKANKVMSPPRKSNIKRKFSGLIQKQSTNIHKLMKSGEEISSNKISNEENVGNFRNIIRKKSNLFNLETNQVTKDNTENIQSITSLSNIRGNKYRGTYNQSRETLPKVIIDEINSEKKEENESKPLEKQNFNWCKYLGHLICCKKKDKKLIYYEEFREKLISEENIIQNYMDIYKLLKICNVKKPVINNVEH